jgi:hypothetical protein
MQMDVVDGSDVVVDEPDGEGMIDADANGETPITAQRAGCCTILRHCCVTNASAACQLICVILSSLFVVSLPETLSLIYEAAANAIASADDEITYDNALWFLVSITIDLVVLLLTLWIWACCASNNPPLTLNEKLSVATFLYWPLVNPIITIIMQQIATPHQNPFLAWSDSSRIWFAAIIPVIPHIAACALFVLVAMSCHCFHCMRENYRASATHFDAIPADEASIGPIVSVEMA